jgi:hypothetical protein
MRFAVSTSAVIFAAIVAPRVADACSPAFCRIQSVLPHTGATVPASLHTIAWMPGGFTSTTGAALTALYELPSRRSIPLQLEGFGGGWSEAFTYRITEPLLEGVEYELAGGACPGTDLSTTGEETSTFRTGPAAALPSTLGTLSIVQTAVGQIDLQAGGMCTQRVIVAYVDLELTHSAEAEPWKDALEYQTTVDGSIYRPLSTIGRAPVWGESWAGRGKERIAVSCEGPREGLVLEGTHVVRISARTPGEGRFVESDAITVELRCPDALPDAGTSPLPPLPDDASVGGDADASVSNGSDAGRELEITEPSSCACSAQKKNSARSWSLFLIGAFLVYRSRSRISSSISIASSACGRIAK